MDNPFLSAIEASLLEVPGKRWREYDLIGDLVRQGYLSSDHGATSLGLFQTHFLVKNALYQLQQTLPEQGFNLLIEPVYIVLEAQSDGGARSGAPATSVESPAVAEFYLDWFNFSDASEASVEALLQSFWRRYVAQNSQGDSRGQALAVLGLDADATFEQVRSRYRRLVMEFHPDRGGCDKEIVRINEAMAVLQRCYR